MGAHSRQHAVSRMQGAVLTVALVLSSLPAALASEMRTWTDNTGQFKIQALLVRIQDGKAVLKRQDGREIQVDLEKLSPADREYAAKNGAKLKNPFEVVEEPKGSGDGKPLQAVESTSTSQDGRTTAINWSSVEMIAVQPPGEWKLTVGKPPAEVAVRKRVFMCPPKREDSEEPSDVIVNRACHRALIGFKIHHNPSASDTRLVLCDLADGRVAQGIGPGIMVPLALSDKGDQVLMRSDEGHDRMDRLELWSLKPGGIEPTAQWSPYGDLDRQDPTVKWATFLSDGRFVTFGACGKLAVWQANPLKPLYYLQTAGNCTPTLSPDGRYVVFASDRKVCVLDTQAGEVVVSQRLSFPDPMVPIFAFSPDGRQLACLSWDNLHILDFATGKVTHELSLKGAMPMGKIVWTDNEHVLVRNATLFNIPTQSRVWAYDGILHIGVSDGLCWCLASGWPQPLVALVPVQLPHPGVQGFFDQAAKHPEFFALRSGDTVRLVLDSIPDSGTKKDVRATLTEKLQASGLKVGDSGTIDLVVDSPVSRETEVPYHSFGSPGVEVHRFREFTVKLRFVYKGESVWESSGTNIPSMFHLKEGQTLDDYLRECEKPSYAWFKMAEFPRFLTRTPSTPLQGMIGRSKLTMSGIEEPAFAPPVPTAPTPPADNK